MVTGGDGDQEMCGIPGVSVAVSGLPGEREGTVIQRNILSHYTGKECPASGRRGGGQSVLQVPALSQLPVSEILRPQGHILRCGIF